jgi:4-amino-4-deoxy-L-arabinose transferase-like glycosyltransferase
MHRKIASLIQQIKRSIATRPKWEKWSIFGIVLVATLLYGIGASHNGYGNSFYAAAVEAGTHSWKAFFFGSLDSSNFITVDKPPFALWAMELSTRIFGFHAWSMLLPEVVAGSTTVYLVYATVRRWFSAKSALLAAAVMACSPVAVLMFGFDNPDAILTLLLTFSVYAFVRALENDTPLKWLTLSAIATGCAFNTKMLQGLIVLPVLAIVYLIAAQPTFWVRVKHLLIAAIPLLIFTLWWPLIVTVTPAADRPYVGSSTDNSIWNLAFGYNGFGRLLGTNNKGKGGNGFSRTGSKTTIQLPAKTTTRPTSTTTGTTQPALNFNGSTTGFGGGRKGGGGFGGSGFGGSTGILRMFNDSFGPNIGWLLPLSLGALVTVIAVRWRSRRTDKVRTAFLVWGGYLVLHIAVFSAVSGTIHPYYPVVMTPAVAALIGMGVPYLIDRYRYGKNSALALPLLIVLTGITATIIMGYQASFVPWLRWLILTVAVVTAVGLLLRLYDGATRFVGALLIASAIACGAAPVVYAIDTATLVHTGSVPTAGPSSTGLQGSNNETSSAEASLISYLKIHRDGAKWLVAVSSANESAPIQLTSGEPVMAVGGFSGSDNAITLANFEKLVTSDQLQYYAVSAGGIGGGGFGAGASRGQDDSSAIQAWVESTATKISYGGSSYSLYHLAK